MISKKPKVAAISSKVGEKSAWDRTPTLRLHVGTKREPTLQPARNAGAGTATASDKATVLIHDVAGQKREVHRIRIADIAVPDGRRACNADTVREIADSWPLLGLIHPITVRSVDRVAGGAMTAVWELVSGGRHPLRPDYRCHRLLQRGCRECRIGLGVLGPLDRCRRRQGRSGKGVCSHSPGSGRRRTGYEARES
jgi:hypothetical protein